jgi:hypothetical protein
MDGSGGFERPEPTGVALTLEPLRVGQAGGDCKVRSTRRGWASGRKPITGS